MNKCICGSLEFDDYQIPKGSFAVSADGSLKNGRLRAAVCRKCGVIRQIDMNMDEKTQYSAYYESYPPTQTTYKAKNYAHDLEVSEKRCQEYGLSAGLDVNLLDVGSGSGAFVDHCRKLGISAYGCDIAKYSYATNSNFIYNGLFEDVHFPTDHFDYVTCHDVLEHSYDPMMMLREMHRTCKQGGTCLIDFPRFFSEEGQHHWKDTEHIWFFNEEQLKQLLIKIGFTVNEIKNPILSKIVFYCTKPTEQRVKILLPPGIGDSYWSMVKLQSFLEREKLGLPDVSVVCDREPIHQGHTRSIPFLDLFPFVHADSGVIANDPNFRTVWHEAYAIQGRTVFQNIKGYDYFISYNGHLRFGEDLDLIDPDLKCNWFPPMFRSIEQETFKTLCQQRYGKYMVLYFPFQGTYKYWTNQFSIDKLIEVIRKAAKDNSVISVFAGAKWDNANKDLRYFINNVPGAIDLTGKTSVNQMFGLIEGSELVFGYPSGLTIISAVLRKLTFILWNSYYDMDFAWLCCPPETRRNNYFIEFTHRLKIESLVLQLTELLTTQKLSIQPELPVAKKISKTQQPVPLVVARRENKMVDTPKIPASRTPIVRTVIACVYKSGGEYTSEYVMKLKNGIARNCSMPHRFVCLSDATLDFCDVIPLTQNYPGWWSKIELFKEGQFDKERIIYFDLDTVIISSINEFIQYDGPFGALGTWNPVQRAARVPLMDIFGSGVMVWKNHNSEFNFLYNEFDIANAKSFRYGDQEYIKRQFDNHNKVYQPLQDAISGIYSYKRNCVNGIPANTKVVCFHGHPRPHEVVQHVKWVKTNWR